MDLAFETAYGDPSNIEERQPKFVELGAWELIQHIHERAYPLFPEYQDDFDKLITYFQERGIEFETFSQKKAARTLEVWGTPASLDIQGVQCVSGDQPIKLENERTTVNMKGTEAVLLFHGNYSVFDRISCTGGGLEQIHLSDRYPMDKARTIIISSLVATPIVGGFGIFLFRRIRLYR